MKLKINTALVLFLFLLNRCNNHEQRKEFAKIEYALFDINSYRTPKSDTAYIFLYKEITADGLVTSTQDFKITGTPKNKIGQLSLAQLDSFKTLFESTIPLKNLVSEYLFKKDTEFFAGNYEYFLVTYNNGEKDSLCTIAPFFKKELKATQDILEKIYYEDSSAKDPKPIIPTTDFRKSLISSYKTNKMLPPITSAPSFRKPDEP